MLTSCHLNEKSREVCIKARSAPASVTKQQLYNGVLCLFSDMPVDVHNDLFLSASLIGEAMQSMVTTVSRKTGNQQVLDILKQRLFHLKIVVPVAKQC